MSRMLTLLSVGNWPLLDRFSDVGQSAKRMLAQLVWSHGGAAGPVGWGPIGQLPIAFTLAGSVKPSTALVFHQSRLPSDAPPPDGFVWHPVPVIQPKVASNFESTGGPQPAAGQVKPMLAGPPEAPIV